MVNKSFLQKILQLYLNSVFLYYLSIERSINRKAEFFQRVSEIENYKKNVLNDSKKLGWITTKSLVFF